MTQWTFLNLGGSITMLHMVGYGHGEGIVIMGSCINGPSLLQRILSGAKIQKKSPVYLRAWSLEEGFKFMDEHRRAEVGALLPK